MDKKKVTRRAAIGVGIGGIAAAPFIIRALKGKYQVKMLEASGPWKIPMKYRGRTIAVEVPRMDLRTPEDDEKFEAIALEQIKKNPQVIAVDNEKQEEWQERNEKRLLARIDEDEKRYLDELAKFPGEEEDKRHAAELIKERMQAFRTQALEHISNLR